MVNRQFHPVGPSWTWGTGRPRSSLSERGVRNEVEDGVCLVRPKAINLSGGGRISGLHRTSSEQCSYKCAKNLRLYYSLLVLWLHVLAFGQSWQITLNSDEILENLSLKGLRGNYLLVVDHNSPAENNTLLPLTELKELRHVNLRKVSPPIKKRLLPVAIGTVAGVGAGWVMSNVVLWWISNEDRTAFTLRWSSSDYLTEGDKLIIKVVMEMSVVIGLLHGFDWGVEEVEDVTVYAIVSMTLEDKVVLLDEILNPEPKISLRKLVQKARTGARTLLKKK